MNGGAGNPGAPIAARLENCGVYAKVETAGPRGHEKTPGGGFIREGGVVVVVLNASTGAGVGTEPPGPMPLCTGLEPMTTEVSTPSTDPGVGRSWGDPRPGGVLLVGCMSVAVSTVSPGIVVPLVCGGVPSTSATPVPLEGSPTTVVPGETSMVS